MVPEVIAEFAFGVVPERRNRMPEAGFSTSPAHAEATGAEKPKVRRKWRSNTNLALTAVGVVLALLAWQCPKAPESSGAAEGDGLKSAFDPPPPTPEAEQDTVITPEVERVPEPTEEEREALPPEGMLTDADSPLDPEPSTPRPWHMDARPPDYPVRGSHPPAGPEPVAENTAVLAEASPSEPPRIWIEETLDVAEKALPSACRTQALRALSRPELPADALRSVSHGSAIRCSVTVNERGEAWAECESPSWDGRGYVAERAEEILEDTPWKPARDEEGSPCTVTFTQSVPL